MGTPHQGGSGVQLGKLLVNIASIFVAADDHLMKHLERDSEWLQQQLGQYGLISNEFVTKFAYEEYETPTVFGHSIMVRAVFNRDVTAADSTGGTKSISRCAWGSRRRADRYPCRPHQYGQVRIKGGWWIQDCVRTFADHGAKRKRRDCCTMGRREQSCGG